MIERRGRREHVGVGRGRRWERNKVKTKSIRVVFVLDPPLPPRPSHPLPRRIVKTRDYKNNIK